MKDALEEDFGFSSEENKEKIRKKLSQKKLAEDTFLIDRNNAKQIAFAWRVVLSQMASNGDFEGKVPTAFKAEMKSDGSLYLKPYDLPEDVVYFDGSEVELPGAVSQALSGVSMGAKPVVAKPVKPGARPAPPAAGSSYRPRKHRRGVRPDDALESPRGKAMGPATGAIKTVVVGESSSK